MSVEKNVRYDRDAWLCAECDRWIHGGGPRGLTSPYQYDGTAKRPSGTLSKFNGLVSKLKGGLPIARTSAWKGTETSRALRAAAASSLRSRMERCRRSRGSMSQSRAATARSKWIFQPSTLRAALGDFSAVIAARNDVLRVNQIAVKQGGRALLSGSVAIPLDLRTPAKPATLIPSNGPLVADLSSAI